MIYLYIIIIFLLLLLFIINNDLIKMIKIISIISILTGIFIQIISKIIVFIINSKVTYISTIKITNRIINKFNYSSFIFLLVGILSYILYLILNAINKKIPLTSS
ncbi:unknown [Clostridium sp. CAG:914]|nr:unknown [Clostridium sp. CAG:914]